MAVHPSVIKRHRQSLKRKTRNQEIKSKVRTLIKKVKQAAAGQTSDTASADIRLVNKQLAKAVSKGIIKPNTASRWLSRLSRSATAKSAESSDT